MYSEGSMAKDQTFKLRLDAQDRERLEAVAAHYSAPAATAIRMLIKEKHDEIRAKRNIGDNEAFDVACIALARHVDREGEIWQQPSAGSSGFEGDEYVLRSTRGELARFTVKDGKLRLKK
jgi:predicted DNA-binding protein